MEKTYNLKNDSEAKRKNEIKNKKKRKKRGYFVSYVVKGRGQDVGILAKIAPFCKYVVKNLFIKKNQENAD